MMTKTQGTLAIILLILVLFTQVFGVLLTAREAYQVQTWNYRIEAFEDESFTAKIGLLGDEGWELASARRAVSGEGKTSKGIYECIFIKRKTAR